VAHRPIAEPGKPRGDQTERYRKIAQDELGSFAGSFEKKVKHLRFWFSLVVTVAGAGFWAATYLTKDTRRIDALEIKVDDIKEQLREIAHHVGARETLSK